MFLSSAYFALLDLHLTKLSPAEHASLSAAVLCSCNTLYKNLVFSQSGALQKAVIVFRCYVADAVLGLVQQQTCLLFCMTFYCMVPRDAII